MCSGLSPATSTPRHPRHGGILLPCDFIAHGLLTRTQGLDYLSHGLRGQSTQSSWAVSMFRFIPSRTYQSLPKLPCLSLVFRGDDTCNVYAAPFTHNEIRMVLSEVYMYDGVRPNCRVTLDERGMLALKSRTEPSSMLNAWRPLLRARHGKLTTTEAES